MVFIFLSAIHGLFHLSSYTSVTLVISIISLNLFNLSYLQLLITSL